MEEEARGHRASVPEETKGDVAAKNPARETLSPKTAETKSVAEQPKKTPPANFSSFILSLATSALVHLGEAADPDTGKKSIALPNARQVIDLMTLLKEKTKGNLTKEEETLVSQLLFTLRMKFVAAEKKG